MWSGSPQSGHCLSLPNRDASNCMMFSASITRTLIRCSVNLVGAAMRCRAFRKDTTETLFHAILIRPLPVPEADQQVNLRVPGRHIGGTTKGDAGDEEREFIYPTFRDLEREQMSFSGIAAYTSFPAYLTQRGPKSGRSGGRYTFVRDIQRCRLAATNDPLLTSSA